MPILYAPILEQAGFISSGSEPASYVYALKSSAYDYAEPTSPIVMQNGGVLSFDLACDVSDASLTYIAKGDASEIYYRGSDSRFRFRTDQETIFTFSVPEIFDGKVHRLLLSLTPSGLDLYVDDSLYGSSSNTNTDTFTINQIGEGVTIFNFTVSNISSYPMLTYDTLSVNVTDEIAGNNLTYVNLKDPLDDNDYLKVVDND